MTSPSLSAISLFCIHPSSYQAVVRWSYRLLLATYGLLGRSEDAARALQAIKERDKRGWLHAMDPLTIRTSAFWLPFKKPADAERLAQGLRNAGIPD